MSDYEDDIPLDICSLETLRELYELDIFEAVRSPRYPYNASLLDRVALWQGDITILEGDSIVNAANSHLGDGSGVNGAIQGAAGPDLLEECLTLGGCETGFAKITKGYELPAKHVIHAVGPIYSRRDVEKRAAQLRSCYTVSLDLAVENDLKHIAFPSLSTGVFGYPIEDATHIALDATRLYLESPEADKLERVVFVVWSDRDREVYRELIPYYFPPENGPTQDEPTRDEPVQDKPTQAEPVEGEPTRDESTRGEPTKGKAMGAELTEDKATGAEPAKDKAIGDEPVEEKSTGSEPTEGKPVQDKPTQDKPAEDEPAPAQA